MPDENYNEYESNMLAQIDEHGWFCQSVFDPEGIRPEFSYSVGFSKTLNGPEFIVFGLPRSLRHNMLWEVFHQLKAGAIPETGMRWSDLIEGFECVSMEVVHAETFTEYAVSANWFWNDQGNAGHPKLYQLIWPGAVSGQFPWDEGCARDIIDSQPALWKPSDAAK